MKTRESHKRWKRDNPERVSEHNKRSKAKLKDKAFAILGNQCANPACKWVNLDGTVGCSDTRCLQIDHVNGNGSSERKNGFNTQHFYYHIAENPVGYQLLCANCNWIKRCDEGEYKGGKKLVERS